MDWLGYDPAAVVIRAGQDAALLDQLGEVGRTLEAIVKASAKKEQESQNQGSDSDHPTTTDNTKEDPRQLLEDFDLAGVLAIVWGGNGDPRVINQLRGFASNLSRYVNLAKRTLQGGDIPTRAEAKNPLTVEGPYQGRDLVEGQQSSSKIVPPLKKHKADQPSHPTPRGPADKGPEVLSSARDDYFQAKILTPLVEHTAKQLMDKEVELQAAKKKLEQQQQRESTEPKHRSEPNRNQTLKESDLNKTGDTRPVFAGGHNPEGRYSTVVDRHHGERRDVVHDTSSERATSESPADHFSFRTQHGQRRDESPTIGALTNTLTGSNVSPAAGDRQGQNFSTSDPSRGQSPLPINRSLGASFNRDKPNINDACPESLSTKEGTSQEGRNASLDGAGTTNVGTINTSRRHDENTSRVSDAAPSKPKHVNDRNYDQSRWQREIIPRDANDNFQSRMAAAPIEQRGDQVKAVAPSTDTARPLEQTEPEKRHAGQNASGEIAQDVSSALEQNEIQHTTPADDNLQDEVASDRKDKAKDRADDDGAQTKQIVTGVNGPGEYQAARDFNGEERFEKVSFSEGDIITVDCTIPGSGNWVWGTISRNGKSGWCPQHYLILLRSHAPSPPPTNQDIRQSPSVQTPNQSSWDEDPDTFLPSSPARHVQEASSKPPEHSADLEKTVDESENRGQRPQENESLTEAAAKADAKADEVDTKPEGLSQEAIIQRHLEKPITAAAGVGEVEQGESPSKVVLRYRAISRCSGDFKACKLSFASDEIITVDGSVDYPGKWVWGYLSTGKGGWCPKSHLRLIQEPNSAGHGAVNTANKTRATEQHIREEHFTARGGNVTQSSGRTPGAVKTTAKDVASATKANLPSDAARTTSGMAEDSPSGPFDKGMEDDASGASTPGYVEGNKNWKNLELVSTAVGYNLYRASTPARAQSPDDSLRVPTAMDKSRKHKKSKGSEPEITPIEVGPSVGRRFIHIEEARIRKSTGLSFNEMTKCRDELGLGAKFSYKSQIVTSEEGGHTRIHYLRVSGAFAELPLNKTQLLKVWILKQSRFPDFPADKLLEFARRRDRPAAPVFWNHRPPPGEDGTYLYYYIGEYRCVKVETFDENEDIRFKAKQCQGCLYLELVGVNEEIITIMKECRKKRKRRPN